MGGILVLHTGGTIGMAPGPQGLAPAPGLVEAAVARLAAGPDAVRVVAFDPLLDSAEIAPRDWNRMLDEIDAFLGGGRGGGVVVTHGTDTMAFTGAALDQALAPSSARVVLCGAMHPLGQGRDAEANLALALALRAAGGAAPAGVHLAFAGALLPAGGLVKHHSHAEAAFRSVPVTPDADAGWRAGTKPGASRRFGSARVAILTLAPGLPVAAVAAALAELDGAVLRVYGAGTAMSDPDLADALAAAVRRGCRLRAVSQCEAGGLSPGAYAAGAALWRAGVEPGGQDTPEAAYVRLLLALGSE